MVEAAIIIPHYNDVKRLVRCLHALVPQLGPRLEVIVVDNASTDSLKPVQMGFPDISIVTEPCKGAAIARNRGVAETTAPWLFFLDSDCVPKPDWVQTALAIAPGADVTGGRITVFDDTPPPRTGAQAFEAVFAFDNRAYVEKKGFSVTANLLTRRDVFMQTGPFVAGLSEDLDWCHRATAKGYGLVYDERLSVEHPSRPDWEALRRKWRRLTEEGFAVNGKSTVARLRWALKAVAMPVSVVVHLPIIMKSNRLHNAQERNRAMTTLLRIRFTRAAWMLKQSFAGSL